ncbi:MAG TPA: ribulose-phosphate 3-epimerase [Candidatus Dormibacteraeota bacterium]
MTKIEVVPSILSADVSRLGDQVREAVAGGADRIQVDVMDGHFVPNLTFGPMVVEAVRRVTNLPIEAHLMVERPEQFIEAFAKSGASLIEVQVESTTSLYRTVQAIKDLGADAGVAINPATPVEALREILPYINLVNVMTVEPGFGGQKFIVHSPDKIRRLRAMAPDVEIEVDGGIDAQTAPLVVKAGATVLVAGSAVFGFKAGIAAGIAAIRKSVG